MELTTKFSAGVLNTFSQKGNEFSTYCSTGESSLEFLGVITTAIYGVRYLLPLTCVIRGNAGVASGRTTWPVV